MQLTTFTDYGLRTLMFLQAHPTESFSVKQIAEYYDISRNHLVKVVHHLSKLSYIKTSKGKGGGIQIAEHTGSLRLGELVASLEPNMTMVECFDPDNNHCRINDSCQLKHYLFSATQAYLASLNQHTLADTVTHQAIF